MGSGHEITSHYHCFSDIIQRQYRIFIRQLKYLHKSRNNRQHLDIKMTTASFRMLFNQLRVRCCLPLSKERVSWRLSLDPGPSEHLLPAPPWTTRNLNLVCWWETRGRAAAIARTFISPPPRLGLEIQQLALIWAVHWNCQKCRETKNRKYFYWC